MKTAWTQNLDTEEEKAKYIVSLRSNRWVLDRLNEILQSMERGLNRQETNPASYDTPNWDYRQAHANGFRQCLRQVQELITLDHEERTE